MCASRPVEQRFGGLLLGQEKRRVADGHEAMEEAISPQQTTWNGHTVCHAY
jgi:hypothetical protein